MNDGGGGDDDDGPQKDNVDIFHSIKIISTYLIRPEQKRAESGSETNSSLFPAVILPGEDIF